MVGRLKRRISPALLAVFVFVFMVAIMIPAVAGASSYYSTLHFKYQLTGSVVRTMRLT